MPPVIIGAGIAAAAGVGAAVITSKSNSKAINKAQTAQQNSEAQQLAYQRETRDLNTGILAPYVQRGNEAGSTIQALLGLGGSKAPAAAGYGIADGQAGMGAVQGQTPQQAAQAAYETFKLSTGYQTRFKEGQGALAANYFGGGVGQSGAAIKAAIRYGNDFAGNSIDSYISQLGDQQRIGFGAGGALAGVSTTFANNAGQISQNGADVASQAAIARARNNGALFTGIAGAAGQVAGALSSYSQPQYTAPPYTPGYSIPATTPSWAPRGF